jgi:hypothetical protein
MTQSDPKPALGSREHAEKITAKRHSGIQSALQWLTFSHLPEGLQTFSRPFYQSAVEIITYVPTDSPELTTTLNKLIEAKDSAVRAGIRHTMGRPGSVSRPQEVIDPPIIDNRIGPNFGRPIQDRPQA